MQLKILEQEKQFNSKEKFDLKFVTTKKEIQEFDAKLKTASTEINI